MNNNHNLIKLIIFSSVFGLASGLVGALLARSYMFEQAFNLPMFGEISFRDGSSGSNLIIRDAKNVVVEQSVKIDEVSRSGRESLMGIYKRKIAPEEASGESGGDDFGGYYRLDGFLDEVFIITSDGWLIGDYLPDSISRYLSAKKSSGAEALPRSALDEYAAIDENNEIYDIEEIISDVYSGYVYWKIKANDLPVKKFAPISDIKNGQMAIALNLEGYTWTSAVSGIEDGRGFVKSSDIYKPSIILNDKINERFYSSFLFNVNGDLLGMINSSGRAIPIDNFLNCINCLLEEGRIRRASLGVFYVDLSQVIDPSADKKRYGALLHENEKNSAFKDSPAYKAGLRDGDIILAVNGQDLGGINDLGYKIGGAKPGEEILVEYLRGDEKKQVNIKLEELD